MNGYHTSSFKGRIISTNSMKTFDRSPIVYASQHFISSINDLIPWLPYECCKVIANHIPMSPTVFALCQQLDVFDVSEKVTEETMNRISHLSKTNFLLMSKIDLTYGRKREIQVYTINHQYDSTMIIYTTEDELGDDDLQLEDIDNYCLVENRDMFREYVLSYKTINEFKLYEERTLYNHNQDEFNTYSGMQYDKIIWTVVPLIVEQTCDPIYGNKFMPLNEFALELMRLIHHTDALAIMIIGRNYYVFGGYGSVQTSIFEIHQNGTITFLYDFCPRNYQLGNVQKLMSCTMRLK